MYMNKYVEEKGLQSKDKDVVKATFLREINSKIETEEQNSGIRPLLTCGLHLTGIVSEKVLWYKICIVTSYIATPVTGP